MGALNEASKAMLGEINQDSQPTAPQAAPAESPVMRYLQESQTRSQAAMAALDARRNQLINLSMSRRNQMFDPQLLAIAQGMFAPTKTGGFGESLGYAARGLQEEQTKQQGLDIQEAKMMYELEAEAMKQREALAAQGLLPAILGGKARAVPSAPAQPTAAQPAAAQPAAQPAAAQPAAQPALSQNLLDQLSDEELLAMSSNPATKNVAETVLKLREMDRKNIIKVRFGTQDREIPRAEYRALENALERDDYDFAKKWYKKHALSWDFVEEQRADGTKIVRPMTTAELEAAKSKATEAEKAKFGKEEPKWVYEIGAYVPMTPAKAADYEEARGAGKGKEWVQKNFPEVSPTAPSAAAPAGGKAALPPRPEEQASKTTTAQKKAESDVEMRTAFVNRGMNASNIVQPAQEIYKLASDPTYSMAMAVIDAPGLGNVVAKAISEGVKAGDFSVGFPNIRTAVMQLKRDKDGRPLSDDQRQQILDGFQKYMQNATQIELLYTQLYLTKQGQVTEGERKLVRATGVDKEDSPTVVKAKAEAIIKRGQFDEKAAAAFLDWEKKNPGGTLEEFQLKSPEYRELKNGLNAEMNSIYEQYFGRGRGRSTTSIAPSQPSGVDMGLVKRLEEIKKKAGSKP